MKSKENNDLKFFLGACYCHALSLQERDGIQPYQHLIRLDICTHFVEISRQPNIYSEQHAFVGPSNLPHSNVRGPKYQIQILPILLSTINYFDIWGLVLVVFNIGRCEVTYSNDMKRPCIISKNVRLSTPPHGSGVQSRRSYWRG